MSDQEETAPNLFERLSEFGYWDAVYVYAPYLLLSVLFFFMLAVRLQGYERVIRENDVFFSGNDPWYHARIVQWTVEHFPATPGFEPWTYFPFGQTTPTGFGGVFDQIIAFAAIVVGGGNPSPHMVEVVTAFAPAVFGAATLIPLYLVVSKLADRWTAVLAAAMLSVFTGGLLRRTMVGSADHQSAEAFFGTLAVAGVFYVVVAVRREKPTLAHVRDRDWRGLRRPVTASLVGGLMVALYLMMWSPGVMLVFVFGVFVVLQMVRNHYEGDSTEYLAFGVFVAFLTATVLTFLYANKYTFTQSTFSLLQPLTTLGVAVGAVFLHGLSIRIPEKDYPWYYYPGAIAGLVVGGLVLLMLVFPEGIDMLRSLVVRVYSFGFFTSPTSLTVAEIQPPSMSGTFQSYSFILLLAMGGGAVMIYRVVDGNRPLELLTLLWGYTMVSAYFTMIRFGYYFSVVVAVFAAFFVWWSVTEFDFVGLDSQYLAGVVALILVSGVFWLSFIHFTDLPIAVPLALLLALFGALWGGNEYMKDRNEEYVGVDLEAYKAISLVLIIFLVVASAQPVWAAASARGANMPWQNELGWVNTNTPEEPLGFNAVFDAPGDGDYDYPVDESPIQGAYGVMSWWDYGHWITYTGRRIPNANPFQNGQIPSADFFTTRDEERAELILEALPSVQEDIDSMDNMSKEELLSVVEAQGRQERLEDTRYVMIDDQMAAGKFGAIATWVDQGLSADYLSNQEFSVGNRSTSLPGLNERYFDTMLSRLYYDDASGLEHYRLVHESERYSLLASSVNLETGRFRVNRLFSRTSYNGNLPGTDLPIKQVNQLPETQTIPAGPGTYVYDMRSAASVKTFERVEGARLTGTARNSSNVTVALRLNTSNTNRSFLYFQRAETDEDGRFSVTVPYPTQDTVTVEEGGTNASVRAVGNYSVYAGPVSIISFRGRQTIAGQPDEVGKVEVSEREVYFGEEVRVEMEPFTDQEGNASTGNSTSGG